ncbi:MAG: hypothetical protein A4E28_03183 [Methanocella sp. PtaU1.Bin125]|nr:MAG: hypothetical protein A4E28_03183 [Methanocella sp. PtaU1.Bin125]
MCASTRLPMAMAVFIAVVLAGAVAEKADARASLADVLATGPNGFEPAGYDRVGTATSTVIDVLGWNATRAMGNVGIGDGSLTALDDTSNVKAEYPVMDIMSADISSAPWSPGLAPSNVTDTAVGNSTGLHAGNATVRRQAGDDRLTYALYHPLRIGRPVDDLLYEHPLATPGTTCCRLVGVRMPSGALVNAGIKCTGYGY